MSMPIMQMPMPMPAALQMASLQQIQQAQQAAIHQLNQVQQAAYHAQDLPPALYEANIPVHPTPTTSPLKRRVVLNEEDDKFSQDADENSLLESSCKRHAGLRNQPMTISDEDRFDPMLTRPTLRRESSLIMPIGREDRAFFGKRDSGFQSFLSAPLPDVLGELGQLDIRCGKCAEGINSLVMIDCDSCQGWYHIRCIGIEFESIPAQWTCGECRLKDV